MILRTEDVLSKIVTKVPKITAGRGSSVGYGSAWYADGRGFDPATFFRGDWS